MKTMTHIALLASLLLLSSGCAIVHKQDTVKGNVRTFRYGLFGGLIPLYSSTETIPQQ